MLEPAILGSQVCHVRRRRLAGRVADQPLLPSVEKLLAPPVVEIRVQPFATAQRRDALFAPQALQHDPNLLFRRELPAGLPANLLNDLLRRLCMTHGALLPRQQSLSYLTASSGPQWFDPTQPPMRRRRVRPASIGQLSSGHRDRDWLPDSQYLVPAAECGWPAATWVLGFKENHGRHQRPEVHRRASAGGRFWASGCRFSGRRTRTAVPGGCLWSAGIRC